MKPTKFNSLGLFSNREWLKAVNGRSSVLGISVGSRGVRPKLFANATSAVSKVPPTSPIAKAVGGIAGLGLTVHGQSGLKGVAHGSLQGIYGRSGVLGISLSSSGVFPKARIATMGFAPRVPFTAPIVRGAGDFRWFGPESVASLKGKFANSDWLGGTVGAAAVLNPSLLGQSALGKSALHRAVNDLTEKAFASIIGLRGAQLDAVNKLREGAFESMNRTKVLRVDALSKATAGRLTLTVGSQRLTFVSWDIKNWVSFGDTSATDVRTSPSGIVQPTSIEIAVYGGDAEQAHARVAYIVVIIAFTLIMGALLAAPGPIPFIVAAGPLRSFLWSYLYYHYSGRWPEGEVAEFRKAFGK